jgi:Tfp pilus assembly protein PilX
MGTRKNNARGFTLIAALLMTVLLSGVAVGVLYMVSNEARMGGNDLEGNVAYYGAQAGIENLTYQVAQLYQSSQAPNAAALCATVNPASAILPTTIAGSNVANITYSENITWPNPANTTQCPATDPTGRWDIVGSGPNQGMVATLIPFTLQVTATRNAGAGQVAESSVNAATGASVNISRDVEVALLPAFEFGIFCDGDCDYFAGPNYNFGGRVHTNSNLYLASGSELTFTDKVAAVGQIVTDRLENGYLTSSGYGGKVYIPTAAGACPITGGPATNCNALPNGSWTGGIPTPLPSPPNPAGTGSAYGGWTGTSNSFNNFIINGKTGATKLQLPFVQSTNVGPIDIIRRPTPGDSQLLYNSRLYTMAQIRILLADTETDLHPDRPSLNGNVEDVELNAGGYPNTTTWNNNTMYYATATKSTPPWIAPTLCSTAATWPLHGEVTVSGNPCQAAWLRVEYCPAGTDCVANPSGWVGVTREWLGYSFGRPYDTPPTAPYGSSVGACLFYPTLQTSSPSGQCYNPLGPAILILQQLQKSYTTYASAYGSGTQYRWLPINMYDAREGEPRDTRSGSTASNANKCSPAGVMNVVELDVGNLWLWLQKAGPYGGGSGKKVGLSTTGGGGYILYFSDRRGMLPDTNPLTTFYTQLSGMSGLNDTVNSASSNGTPDGVPEPATYYAFSPEDVAGKSLILGHPVLDNWGETYLGAGFNASPVNMVYYVNGVTNGIPCTTSSGCAEWNMVTGPRHALRLVDGGMDGAGNSYLPQPPATKGHGFTVASEQPVYVYGDYNSGFYDPAWAGGNLTNNLTTPHSAAAIIADAVTLLSNPPTTKGAPTAGYGWTDWESFSYPYCAPVNNRPSNCPAGYSRPGNNAYYRVAIATGKSIPFPKPSWGGPQDFGTDGGMHNFLRYLEDRSAGSNGTVRYLGSMISMFYSQYATGNFKCCNAVYGAPNRDYYFDTLFQDPNNLPPGTPEFQDVVSLSYHQSFNPQ